MSPDARPRSPELGTDPDAAKYSEKDSLKDQNKATSISTDEPQVPSIATKKETLVSGGSSTEDEASENADNQKDGFACYVKLWHYATAIDTLLRIVAFFAACAAGTALPLMTIVFGRLVNDFNGWGSGTTSAAQLKSAVNKNALYFVYLFIAKFVLVYTHSTSFTITAIRATRAVRLAYIKAILRQDMTFFDTCSPGSVATKISNNASLIQNGLSEKVGVMIQGLAMLVASFVVAFVKGWKLTLVVATLVPGAVIAVGVTVALDTKLEAKILDVYSRAGGIVEESLSSIRVVTAFNANKKLWKKYDDYLDEAKAYGVKKGPVLGVQYSVQFFFTLCSYSLAFWYGIKLLVRGEVPDSGTVVTVLFSVLIGMSSLTMIAPSVGELTKAAAAASDVLRMIEREPAIDSTGSQGNKPEKVSGELELRDVAFAYPARPSINVLDGVSLKAEAHKVTALVGASGSGKSTVVGLLERWYDPANGSVLFDGADVKDLNVNWLRSQIGLVQQEPVLFNDTIYNNVAFGLHGTEMADQPEEQKRELVRNACVEANADFFIQQLPQGYDTAVGEKGGLLSGGQKQRVAIARSIISNPRILLLDEATSALDPKAEGVVQAALDKVSRSRTTIMIAHKLSTVKKADKIVVMNKGKIIEQGTHQSLIEAQGAYSRLVNAQDLDSDDTQDDRLKEKKIEEAQKAEQLERTLSVVSAPNAALVQAETADISRKYSLFRCLIMLFYERRSYWAIFTAGGLASAAAGATFPLQAVFFSKIVTVFQLTQPDLERRGNFWALMFFVLALATLVSYACIGLLLTIAAFITSRFYRSEYFAAMLSQDIDFYDRPENSSGSLTARLSTDPQHLQDLVSSNIGLIIVVIVDLVSCIALALALGWKLALVATFGCLPALFAAGFIRMRMEIQSQDKGAKLFLESARFASEAVGAIKTVSSLTLESKVYESYASKLQIQVHNAYRHVTTSMIFFGLSESIDLLAMGLAFWYGGRLLADNQLSVVNFFIVFIAIIFGGQAAGMIFGYTLNTTKAHAAMNRIFHLRKEQPPINSSTGVEPLPPGSPSRESKNFTEPAIEFKDVTFRYASRPDYSVLRGLSLTIHRGQSVGLVGPSGCGKSTIIALLERFYDTTSGSIILNGTQPLPSLDVKQYRSTVGLVSQDTVLYQGTIRENVLLGLPDDADVAEEKITEACKAANIHDFVLSLPDGYATQLGSRGLALSGGQRQRLAIARALLRDPQILLLDEATSALDTESEKLVQDAIERASVGRTTIAVAHRLSTVRGADRVFVLERGKVAEEGGHAELMRLKGRYWEMCMAQSLDREAV